MPPDTVAPTGPGAELLREAGEALYGRRWQFALAHDLEVADRTVRRWLAGASPIPDGLWADIKKLVTARRQALAALRRKLPRT
jgi:hypothetical protein